MSDTVKIFDTTLRDGEQSPGISLDVGEKLEIAEQLARLGVDVIEAGFPIASRGRLRGGRGDRQGACTGPIIAGAVAHRRSRTSTGRGRRCGTPTKPRIHVFIATSTIHMEKKLRMTPEQVKAEAAAAVARAKSYTDDVEFSPEDGYRSDPDFMCEVCQIAVDNGATTLNIPDTVGYGVPEDYGKLIRYVIDDGAAATSSCRRTATTTSGLAVANSLAGVAAGARQVECAINGLGERAGNAALEEVVMAIRTRARLLRRRRRRRADRGAGPHVAAGVPPHRLPGAVQQGGRRPQRVRARGGHPPARRARGPRDLRDHRRRRPSARKPRRSCSASTPAATRSPTRSRRWACTCRATR